MNAYRTTAPKPGRAHGIRASLIILSGALALVFLTVGCEPTSLHHADSSGFNAYDSGYAAGFSSDADYYDGYDDGWFTVGNGPILYSGGSIPFLNDDSEIAGFWDGVYDAYNDGYFVEYRYAFVIGFSEGYDNAFWPDYLNFLATDTHPEFAHGGFSDGYHDGFSEGRVFGAFDYETGLPFDWLDALLDWEGGTDLFFSEIPVGTGASGPVVLYEWGTDPTVAPASAETSDADGDPSTRTSDTQDERPSARSHLSSSLRLDIARPLTFNQQLDLTVIPTTSLRNNRTLGFTSTWLDRIDAYNSTGSAAPSTTRSSMTR
ncbi:MAG: hypothetical protein IID08_06265 [Candidatus Hydrogenedentes bacterium]|nr:hypothetical protein [Candidatus Hydrogenedentota bacterium]